MTTSEGKHTSTENNFSSKTKYYFGKVTYDITLSTG